MKSVSRIVKEAANRRRFLRPDDWRRLSRAIKYRYREAGFFRVNVCGWRIAITDASLRRACFSDQQSGIQLGRFVICLRRNLFIDGQVRL